MDFSISVKINNDECGGGYKVPVVIINSFPTITWSFGNIDNISINEYTGLIEEIDTVGQNGYEIRISNSNINIGTDYFIGNKIQTGVIYSQDQFWNYVGIPLERGQIYYGQIQIQDDFGRESKWATFSFKYNNLPYISNISISPGSPTINDDLKYQIHF